MGITTSPTASDPLSRTSSLCIANRLVVSQGRWLKIARIHDELWLEGQPVEDPVEFLRQLKESPISADVFTFAQNLPWTEPRYDYPTDWDNLAVAPTSDFSAWWEGLPQETRKNIRRAERRGLVVRDVPFDRTFVQGIKNIYDETPIRQGRRFPHYNKSLEAVERQNSSYLDRSNFIGAFYNGDLVGFLKVVFIGSTARIMQILSMNAHFDKRPTNALLAKGVEGCSKRGLSHLIYGQYVYDGKIDSPVTEFKRRNGFHQVLLPRYYISLTAKGKLAIRTGFHRGFKTLIPNALVSRVLKARERWYASLEVHKEATKSRDD